MGYHLPNLEDVILCHGCDDPRLIGIPSEIRNLIRMTSMNELDSFKKVSLRVSW